MDRQFSTYLHLLRVIASLAVVVSHALHIRFTGALFGADTHSAAPAMGHHAVIFFFVLSGLVIASSVDRVPDLRSYAEARLSRLFSVVVPMLLIVPLLDTIGRGFEAALYAGDEASPSLPTIVAALTFSGQFWFSNTAFLSNEPFWSISYEAAYYALFGVWYFRRGPARWLMLALLAAIVGPNILLLAPAWIAGVLLYRHRHRVAVTPAVGAVLMLASALAYVIGFDAGLFKALTWYGVAIFDRFGGGAAPWGFAAGWPCDYLVAALVVVHLIGAMALFRSDHVRLDRVEPLMAWLAGGSFALYLFHYPILMVVAAIQGASRFTPAGAALLFVSSVAGSYLLAEISDRRLRAWRRVFGLSRPRPLPA